MSHITRRIGAPKLDACVVRGGLPVACQAEVGIALRRGHPADAPLNLLGGAARIPPVACPIPTCSCPGFCRGGRRAGDHATASRASSSSGRGTAESTPRGAPLDRRSGGGGSGSFPATSGKGGALPRTVDPGTGGWGTAMPGRPGPGVKPPARCRGKSRDSCMLDWDAPARLTPLPPWRHVSRTPAPSPPRTRHCAAAGSPSRRAATVWWRYGVPRNNLGSSSRIYAAPEFGSWYDTTYRDPWANPSSASSPR